jgi:hypothetical protein
MKKSLFSLFVGALSMCALSFTSCGNDDPSAPVEYTITVTSSAGGTASAGVTKAFEGTPITLLANAETNFSFDRWVVEAGGISVANTNPATFVMPASNVTIRAEFRDATLPPNPNEDLVGSISGTKTLDASTTYTITGPVIVEDGGILTIPAGTTIKARRGFNSYILVLRGGKINVNGTAAAPVVMTADVEDAEAGYWGGLIINGYAPLSGATEGETEISKQFLYGGDDEEDNSGSITYLVLACTGARSSAAVEHNGLTLNGVGRGTTIENIFVYEGSDDGIEFFGGSVDVTNLLVYNSDDDMFDFTQGYSGTLTNAYGIWDEGYTSSEADPRGIEADGNLDGENPEYDHQSNFRIDNITFDLRLAYFAGTPVYADGGQVMQDLMKIRRNASATITNALVKGTGRIEDLIDISDGSQNAPYETIIAITNSLTNTPTGALVKPAAYPGVTIESGHTGCATDIFNWVGDAGYDIF